MALTFPPQGTPHWMRRVEQALLQNHVDIQRLWGIVPQIPDQVPGIPFTGPLEPSWFVVPSSTSSQRSRSSHNSSTSPGSSSSGSSSSAAGSSSGSSGSSGSSSHDCSLDVCMWQWYDVPFGSGTNMQWVPYSASTTCDEINGCDCTEPAGSGAYYGELREGTCGGVAGSSSSGSSGSSSSNGECGGTCLITYIAGAWMVMSDNCTGVVGCECVIPEEASYEGDIRTVSCWPALDP